MVVGLGNNLTASVSLATDAEFTGTCRICRWHPCWHTSAAEYAQRWTSPAVLTALPALLASRGLQPDSAAGGMVAVHVRCSDIPFAKNPLYHLPSVRYWSWAIDQLRRASDSRHAIVHHDGHWSGSTRSQSSDRIAACEEYAAAVAHYLRRNGYSTTLAPRGLSEQLALQSMLGADALLTTCPSSFSFLPGLVKLDLDRRWSTGRDGTHERARSRVEGTAQSAEGTGRRTAAKGGVLRALSRQRGLAPRGVSRYITPQFYAEAELFPSFYASMPRGWRVGARGRCSAPLPNLSEAVRISFRAHVRQGAYVRRRVQHAPTYARLRAYEHMHRHVSTPACHSAGYASCPGAGSLRDLMVQTRGTMRTGLPPWRIHASSQLEG